MNTLILNLKWSRRGWRKKLHQLQPFLYTTQMEFYIYNAGIMYFELIQWVIFHDLSFLFTTDTDVPRCLHMSLGNGCNIGSCYIVRNTLYEISL